MKPITIPALREESDGFADTIIKEDNIFQSTLSARRATPSEVLMCKGFNDISIHALREESDQKHQYHKYRLLYFNPRSPRGERPFVLRYCYLIYIISIHALREESDRHKYTSYAQYHISIHALREESDW